MSRNERAASALCHRETFLPHDTAVGSSSDRSSRAPGAAGYRTNPDIAFAEIGRARTGGVPFGGVQAVATYALEPAPRETCAPQQVTPPHQPAALSLLSTK